jgi:alkylation response protein AidB-like acyl-CoA dehydrogenase
MYPGLTYGAADLLEQCATEGQKHKYVTAMVGGRWGGTMCLTEPHAGSDVGSARTTASKNADGTYSIRGTKIYISAGDHDLAENVIHLVLARIDGAPAGTKGLSLFIVPACAHPRRRHARARATTSGGLHRAQDGHQRLGHLRAQLRGERRVPRRARGRRRERRHVPDVSR